MIFDLGNVIFKCSFDNTLHYWADSLNIEFTKIKDEFSFDKAHELLEKGIIKPHEYIDHVSEMLNINFNENEFINGWISIYEDIIPGIPELLNNLKNRYRLIALTNSNEIHYPIWNEKYKNELSIFEKIFSSHLIECRKPEKESYELVLNYLQLAPSEVIFLDDNIENVSSAMKIGINSILVSSYDKMEDDLNKLNIFITENGKTSATLEPLLKLAGILRGGRNQNGRK